jgi:hypothetical protein
MKKLTCSLKMPLNKPSGNMYVGVDLESVRCHAVSSVVTAMFITRLPGAFWMETQNTLVQSD